MTQTRIGLRQGRLSVDDLCTRSVWLIYPSTRLLQFNSEEVFSRARLLRDRLLSGHIHIPSVYVHLGSANGSPDSRGFQLYGVTGRGLFRGTTRLRVETRDGQKKYAKTRSGRPHQSSHNSSEAILHSGETRETLRAYSLAFTCLDRQCRSCGNAVGRQWTGEMPRDGIEPPTPAFSGPRSTI